LLVLRLVDLGKLDLQAGIGDYLPTARSATIPGVTIQRLLCHTSGLPLEIPHDFSTPPGSVRWHAELKWPGEMAEACLDAEPVSVPGTTVQYSNIAYGLLGLAAERMTDTPYARLLDQHVFDPLGINAFVGRSPDYAVLEVSGVTGPHAGTRIEPYNSAMAHRFGVPWAGVGTNAAGLLALVRAYASGSKILSADTARVARTDQTEGRSGGFKTTEAFMGHGPSRAITWSPCSWGLSVEVQGGKEPHWSPSSLPESFGQIGSSGCLAWHDPKSGVSWAFFGARTAESGWLLRHGGRIAQSALSAACNSD
jgi:beta-lactamase class C